MHVERKEEILRQIWAWTDHLGPESQSQSSLVLSTPTGQLSFPKEGCWVSNQPDRAAREFEAVPKSVLLPPHALTRILFSMPYLFVTASFSLTKGILFWLRPARACGPIFIHLRPCPFPLSDPFQPFSTRYCSSNCASTLLILSLCAARHKHTRRVCQQGDFIG
jgi:hypothetical protein